ARARQGGAARHPRSDDQGRGPLLEPGEVRMSELAALPSPGELVESLTRAGVAVETGGNRPFLLDDMDAIWVVRSGRIELYSVRLEGLNGRPVERRRLVPIEAGRLRWGAGLLGRRVALLAVASGGAEVIRVQRPHFTALCEGPLRNAAAEALDAWLGALSSGVAGSGRTAA